MADGELTLKLDDETARRLQAAADAAGRPVADYAAGLIANGLEDRWAESLRRLAEYDRTGESISVEEALAHFDDEVRAQVADKH
jgi:predicted transcriptional regulator